MTVIQPETPNPGSGRRIKLTLTEFLLARIAEDEAYLRSDCGDFARDCQECAFLADHANPPYSVDRLLAECEAKRSLIDRSSPEFLLRALALPYSGHPDYREEWRP